MQQAADRPHRLDAQVGGRFEYGCLLWGVYVPVGGGKQRKLLTRVATGEFGFGPPDSARVEPDDVEALDDFIAELLELKTGDRSEGLSEWNSCRPC